VKLEWFRRHRKKILGFLAVFLMVTWGMGSSLYYLAERRHAGIIFGEKVPLGRFMDMIHRWQAAIYRRQVDRATLIESGWRHIMMLHEANDYGIGASRREIAEYAVARLGRPKLENKAAYVSFLKAIGLSESAYEQTIAEAVRIQKLRDFIRDSVKITPDEVWERYAADNEKIKVKYIKLTPDDFIKDIKVTEEELLDFYKRYRTKIADPENAQPGYKLEEAIKVAYIVAEYDEIAKTIKVPEEELRKYYEEHKESFKVAPEKKKTTAKKEDKDKKKKQQNEKKQTPTYKPFEEVKEEIRKRLARKKAESEVEKIMDEADRLIEKEMEKTETVNLKTIAQKLGKKVKYVESDFVSIRKAGELIEGCPDFNEEVKRRDERDPPSTVMSCPKGKFIFVILARRPPRILTFEEAKPQVEKDLRREKALKRAVEVATSIAREIGNGDISRAIALLEKRLGKERAKKLSVKESKFFGRPQFLPFGGGQPVSFDTGLPGNHPKFAEEAFNLTDKKVGVAVEEGKDAACYLMQLAGKKPAERKEFEEKKKIYTEQYRYEKMREVLALWEEDLRERSGLKQFKF